MTLKTVAILSPGDMGHAVGRCLREGGLDVVTCLNHRSERTRILAEAAGIRDLPDLGAVATESDLVLAIMAPTFAEALAEEVAAAISGAGEAPYYADCNAISPETTRSVGRIITGAGARFIDASIIGNPPGTGAAPRFYTSGPHAPVMDQLDGMGIIVRNLGDEVGRASAIKMCYAGLTKGTSALYVAVLLLAESLGLSEELGAELSSSQGHAYGQMQAGISRLPARALRWIGEMEEIAATYGSQGLPPGFHQGAAAIYRLLGETPFADERAESVDHDRTTAETVRGAAGLLKPPVEGR